MHRLPPVDPELQSTLAIVAVVLSALSFALACLALGWQVASWLLSGGRVKATLKHGVLGPGSAVTRPVGRSGGLMSLATLHAQGFIGTEVLAVDVANVGRAPVTVARYSGRLLGAGVSFVPVADAMGPALPCRIDPGESQTWYADMAAVRALVATGQELQAGARQVRMAVELGTGKTVETRTAARI